MNFKRFSTSDNQWHDVPYYQHKTATDTLTLPAVIYPNDTSITLGIKGNTVQDGTPTPTTPIQPQETGDRTGNLLDYTTVESTTNATATQISGGISVSGRYYVRFRTVEFTVGSTYTMSWKANTTSGTSAPSWRFHYSDNTYSSMPSSGGALIAEKEVSELLLYVSTSESCIVEFTEIMLNLGSTALPYEPYGYKIPISMGGTTNNVYLGEVQTTRQIKKLVLDGTENWVTIDVYYTVPAPNVRPWGGCVCTHCAYQGIIGGNSNTRLWVKKASFPDYQTLEDFKSYLAQQYANGTPVTVWYSLATSETAVVNEPLMKIGTYADSLTTSIPCTAGENTLDVQTTVQPSEVTAGFSGWHPVQSVHERENGQWD